MGVPTPTKMVEAFAKNAPTGNIPGGKTVPFPVSSQIPLGQPGRASLDDGYTEANMTPIVDGGQPMNGPDTNGVLFLISGPVVSVSAGNIRFPYDGTYATAISGYDKGAQVLDATDPTLFWTSNTNGNSTDPAAGGGPAVWIASRSLYSTSAPTAGTHADNVLPGPSDYFLDVDTTAGAITLNGFVAQRDGQLLVISNTGANLLSLGVAAGTVGNQIRANSGPLDILSNDSLTIKFLKALAGGLGAWVVV